MDVAITGSSGLIGSALRDHLSDGGHRVLRVIRERSASTRTGADSIAWDPAAGTIDAAGLEGIDAVVHLAGEGIGEKRWTPDQKRVIRESRTQGTALIATTLAGLATPPKVFVSGSAIGWYGNSGPAPVDETAPAAEDFLASVVVDWEAAATPASDAGIRTALIRTGIVLSPKGGALKKQLPIFKLGLGGRFGSGAQMQSWISLDDEIGGIEFLLDHDVSGPVNLTAPHAVTNAAFTKALGAALHRPTSITPILGPRLLLGRELADALLLTSTNAVPAALTAAGYHFIHPTLDAALADLLG